MPCANFRNALILGNVMLNRILFTLCFSILSVPASYAGSVIEIETVEHLTNSSLAGTVRISTQGQKTRLDIQSSGGDSTALIFDGAREEMMILEHREQKYFVMTREQLDAMAVQVSDAMKQMDAALAAMPPEQRAMAKQMMRSRMPAAQPARAASNVSKSGGSDTVVGYDCENYEVRSEGRKVREMCVTPWDDIEGGRESADAFVAFADFFSNMREAFSGMGEMSTQQDMFEHLKSLGGYPVLSREFDEAGALSGESRMTSARSENLDASVFTAPAGYQKQSIY